MATMNENSEIENQPYDKLSIEQNMINNMKKN